MDCKDVIRDLPSLLYGELTEEAARPLDEHLESCPACQKEWERLKKTLSLLDQWKDVDVPLATASAGHAPDEKPYPSGYPSWLKPLSLAIAACLLVIVTLAVAGVEVRKVNGGMVITLGRPAAEYESFPASMELGVREMVRCELEDNLDGLFQAVVHHVDEAARKQEAKHDLLATAFHLQREKDLRLTRNLVHKVALESAAESELTRRCLEGMTDMIRGSVVTDIAAPEKKY
ncbi:MAG: anti-sigma factor family protein [Planctomycetota bacterium]|jgi:hypothetical protein